MLNTERDELAEDIRGLGITVIDGPPVDLTEPLAQHLHNLGYRKPRTITTVEELEELPVNSVIVDYLGSAYQWGIGLDGSEGWASTRDSNPITTNHLLRFQPLTVLHEATS